MLRKIDIKFSVYVPDNISNDDNLLEEYLNDKLYTDPEFYGYIDPGCFNITNETFEE